MSYAQFWSNPLFLMAKPPPDLADLLAALARADRRAPDRLHITLMLLGFAQPERVAQVIAALDTFDGAAFRVCFNGIHCSGETVALRGNETMRGAIRFQAMLCDHLRRHGIALPAYSFHPHITLTYRPDNKGSEMIDAVSWRVEDIRLIESVQREGLHIERGRWPLGTAATPSRYLSETRCHMSAAPFL